MTTFLNYEEITNVINLKVTEAIEGEKIYMDRLSIRPCNTLAIPLDLPPVISQRIDTICMNEGRNVDYINFRKLPQLEGVEGVCYAVYECDENTGYVWFVEWNEVD